jgi:hypothetical protein
MTFTVKHRGASSQPMVCVYTCPEHGEFDAEVQRDENGNSPDVIECPLGEVYGMPSVCGQLATWTPSPVFGKVKPWEVVRGSWEKPARPTYLDTRELGEGQSYDDFKKKRAAIWEEKRKADVMRFKQET